MAILTLSRSPRSRLGLGEPIVPVAPKHLKRWTAAYGTTSARSGRATTPQAVGQSRDSDCLEQSNFAVMLARARGRERDRHGGAREPLGRRLG